MCGNCIAQRLQCEFSNAQVNNLQLNVILALNKFLNSCDYYWAVLASIVIRLFHQPYMIHDIDILIKTTPSRPWTWDPSLPPECWNHRSVPATTFFMQFQRLKTGKHYLHVRWTYTLEKVHQPFIYLRSHPPPPLHPPDMQGAPNSAWPGLAR
jgi:hypothetical protein